MSTSTTLPRRPAGVSGEELIHSPPISNEGSLPSAGSAIEDVIIGFMGFLQSVAGVVEANTGLASITVRASLIPHPSSRQRLMMSALREEPRLTASRHARGEARALKDHRSDLNPVRRSETMSMGRSHAAKWAPLGCAL